MSLTGRLRIDSLMGRKIAIATMAATTCLTGVSMIATAAYAQTSQALTVDIPAGPLPAALERLGQQTGLQISYVPGIASGKTTGGVSGTFSPEAAIRRLLAGTGLGYSLLDGIVTIRATSSRSVVPGAVSADAILLEPITLSAQAGAAAVYEAPRSSVYISQEQLDRVGRSSATDILRGQPGVQVGDGRNGGGVDVNIRGVQGQGRVAVTVDGSQQSLNVYRGYAGTQIRSYIDPDMISEVTINKGTTIDPGTAGAIGGSVNMTTLRAEDILQPGKKWGLRLRGELQNNGIAPPYRGERQVKSNRELHAMPGSDRGNILNSDSKSGSIAAAFAGDNWDFVGAYSRREQGNYVAGTEGRDKYRRFTIDYKGDPYEENSVARVFEEGEEVLNSSSETESVLLKGNYQPAPGHKIELSYRYFDGQYGDVMPSTIYRLGTAGIMQYPLSSVEMNSATLRYEYDPAGNDLINLSAKLWVTDSKSDQISLVKGPASLNFDGQYDWAPYRNTRIGLDVINRSEFATAAGEFTLDLGAAFQHENLEPKDWVVITDDDRAKMNIMRDAYRWEANVSGRLEYRPNDRLSLWGGLQYSKGRTQDRNETAVERMGVVTSTGEKMSNRSSGLAPSIGVKYNFAPDTFVYATYKEAIRIPSLFDTTMGTLQNTPTDGLKPERSKTFEVGASAAKDNLFGTSVGGAFKLAYFDTEIENYITRYFDELNFGRMLMTNADSFSTRGLELQSKLDNGRFFADLSVTHYLAIETCDADYAQHLRDTASSWQQTADTPNCTAGSFMGSYTNTQNPPKTAVNLTVGTRLRDERLTLGGRMSYTSGPTETLDEPWNTARTTDQLKYQPVAIFDAFMSYELRDSAVFNASVSNITDRYYLDPLAQSYMPAPGRTFRAALTMKF
ncbi:TonB-dependent receptor [Paracoccus xiamenensis]|uniref:TonB-dependent receptor n=1 Tax=Paracoccus xiamenensis TaxID=2714901 RepID=UPI00140A159D|nr:TonB-dependent receptor [Paracoccus xiamenensis]NHF74457.1 TonB-dependent receptor [Paracoccus xiamenensis]